MTLSFSKLICGQVQEPAYKNKRISVLTEETILESQDELKVFSANIFHYFNSMTVEELDLDFGIASLLFLFTPLALCLYRACKFKLRLLKGNKS